ncbi:hypothetical protein C5167_044075 [Papaver somniferum]|uniref:Uncharacterized protein n=1 Tax=Papaver somniferum TaxID=3469 RepID=A0A4Y7L9X9_PAPSO|nr:hypothetical protein C5167_044075 [Papaver somniferum]
MMSELQRFGEALGGMWSCIFRMISLKMKEKGMRVSYETPKSTTTGVGAAFRVFP